MQTQVPKNQNPKPTDTWMLFRLAALLVTAAVPMARAGTGNDLWSGGGGNANWSTAANWAASSSNTPPIAGDTLVFGTVGGGGATLNNNLTLGTPFLGLTFNANAPAFTLGGNAITNSGGISDNSPNLQTINLPMDFPTNAAHALNTSGGTTVINGVISDGGGLAKAGAGTVSLTAANTYTGVTAANGGTLELDFTAAGAPSANIVSASSTNSLGGGTLLINGNNSTASSQTFAATILPADGGGVVNVASATPGANLPTVSLGTLAANYNVGGTLVLNGPATTTGQTSSSGLQGASGNSDQTGFVTATATITSANGGNNTVIIGPGSGSTYNAPFATVGLYDFAGTTGASAPYTIAGLSQLTGGTAGEGLYTLQNGGNLSNNSGIISDIVGAVSTHNTTSSLGIRFNTSGGSVSSTTVVSIEGVLNTPNVGANNSLISATGANGIAPGLRSSSGGAIVIWQNDILGYLNITSPLFDDSGKPAGTIVQAGPGTVNYTGANAYTGQTYLNNGVSEYHANNGLGAVATGAQLNMNGGTALAAATFTLDNAGNNKRNIVLGNTSGGLAAVAGFTLTADGIVSGAGSLVIGIPASANNGSVAGLVPGTGAGTANATALNATGTVILNAANTYAGGTVINLGTLNINGINALGGANYGGLVINGGTLQYSTSFSGNGSGDLTSIGTGGITLAAGGGTIDLNGNLVTYTGSIGNGGSGTLAVNSSVIGGILTLGSANTYTGNTTLNNGATLLVTNASGSGTGSGNVTVTSGATLGGTGAISGNVNWQSGSFAILTPGKPLTVGVVTLNGNALTVNVPGGSALSVGSYTLLNYTAAGSSGSFSTGAPTYAGAGVSAGTISSVSTSGGVVTLTVIATGVAAIWTNDVNSVWSSGVNWNSNPTVPHSPGDAATFGVGSALRTVTLDANETVGGIALTNANSFVIANAGNTLTLDNKGSGAVVSVLAGTANAINTAVALNDNVVATVSSGDSVAVNGAIANVNNGTPKTLAFNGTGKTILAAANSYGPSAGSVGTTLSGGTVLQVANNNALGAGDLSVVSVSGGTLQAGAVGLALPNNIVVGSTVNVDNNGNDLALNGTISGGSLTKVGNHTLTLNGNNTYSGNTMVNNGALSISTSANVQNTPIVLNGGDLLGNATFTINNNVGIGLAIGSTGTNGLIDAASGQAFNLSGTVASAGNTGANGLTVNSVAVSPGTVILSGANTFNGNTVIAAGALQLASSAALQNSTLNYSSGTLWFDSSITAATFGGLSGGGPTQTLELTNLSGAGVTLTVGNNNASTTYSGNISDTGVTSGAGALIKLGSGTWTLAGTSSYTGATTVSGGTLVIPSGGLLSSGGTLTLPANDNQEIFVNGGILAGTALAMDNGIIGLTISNGLASFTGNVAFGADNGNVGNLLQVSGGTLNAGSITSGRTGLSITAQPTAGQTTSCMYVNGGTINVTNNFGVGGLSSGANSNTSLRIDSGSVNAGTLSVGLNNGGRWSVVDVNGGTLSVADTTTGISLGDAYAGDAILLVRGGTVTAGAISMGQTASTAVLSMTNGSLYIGSGGIVQSAGTATISLAGGTLGATAPWTSSLPMTLAGTVIQAGDSFGNSNNITLNGVLSGATNLVKIGKGILALGGVNTYSGLTIVTNGTLVVNGSTAGSGVDIRTNATLGGAGGIADPSVTIEGGAHTLPGGYLDNPTGVTLSITNNLSYNSGAEADFNAGSTYNSGNDQLVVNGNLTGTNLNVGISFTGGAGNNLDTTGYYNLFHVNGSLAGASFNSTPVWIGTPPANASQFVVAVLGNNVVLNGSPIAITSATATPNPAGHNQVVSFAVNVTAGGYTINPSSGIVLNASSIIGGLTSLDLVQSNGTSLYTNSIVVPAGTTFGPYALSYTITDSHGDSLSPSLNLTIGGAPEVWNGNASPDNTWANALNWANGLVPLTGDLVVFAGTHQLTPNMESSYTVDSLNFASGAGSFNITNSANTLTLAGGLTNNSANVQTLSVPVALSGGPGINAAAANIVISNAVSDDGNGFTKTGTNTLTLTANNTYGGPITVNNGVLALYGDDSSASSTVSNNATLLLGSPTAVGGSSTLALDSGSILQMRSDITTGFYPGQVALQNASDILTFDVGPLTSGITGNTLTLSGPLLFSSNSDQSISVTGNSTYTLALGDITLTTSSHTPIFNLFVNTLPNGPAVTINSVTFGNWDNALDFNGGGNVTVEGALSTTSNGAEDLFINNGTTVTLLGASGGSITTASDGNKCDVVNGTLILDNNSALINDTDGTGLNASFFVLGAATNLFYGAAYTQSAKTLTVTNNNFNAAIYLSDAINSTGGGLATAANLTNYVSDGDINFTNSGVFTIGGQNTSGVDEYANPIILGWTLNRGKSVTLVAATGGEVDFAGILANGEDQTAGVTVGDAVHHGLVKFIGSNTYRGNTTINGGTLEVANPNFSSNSVISIASGTLLQLDFTTTNTVTALILNGTLKAPGVYSSATTPTYIAGTGSLKVVGPSTPIVQTAPIASGINYGQTLAASTLTGGSVTNTSGTAVSGTFAFTTPSTVPPLGVSAQAVTFTPTDTVHYSAFTFNVNVTSIVSLSALKFTASPVISGTTLTLSGTNTGAGTFYVLASTNAAAPLRTWTPIWTNTAGGSGIFVTNLTGAVNPSFSQQFYILSSTNN